MFLQRMADVLIEMNAYMTMVVAREDVTILWEALDADVSPDINCKKTIRIAKVQ